MTPDHAHFHAFRRVDTLTVGDVRAYDEGR
jgi:hypothetical protein